MTLLTLRVRNFVLVRDLELEFSPGMNVLTGETGAGKSLLIGALSLVLGDRVDWAVLGEEMAEVEASFQPTREVRKQLRDMGLEDELLVVRRVLDPRQRRSRIYVNGAQVPVSTLRALTRHLVEIHGQHEHQVLLDEETHLDFLDAASGLGPLREEVHRLYHRLEGLKAAIREEEATLRHLAQMKDLYTYQLEELRRAGLREGEEEELENQVRVLQNMERLMEAVSEAALLLYEGEGAAYDRMARVRRLLEEAAGIDQKIALLVKELNEALALVEDLAQRLIAYREGLTFDPDELQMLAERLNLIRTLKSKYRRDVPGLIALMGELEEKLQALQMGDERLQSLKQEAEEVRKRLEAAVQRLHEARVRAARHFEAQVLENLRKLAFEAAVFRVEIEEGLLTERGKDRVRFLFSANPGEPPRPLSRVASGGELSRIMLALKTVLADVDQIPTLVFDEIDIGIGGRTAEIVGRMLKALARRRQILVITHLPQIAVYGDRHFRVEKRVQRGRTETLVTPLEGEDRVREIARMVAGERITDSSLRHARTLLTEAQKG